MPTMSVDAISGTINDLIIRRKTDEIAFSAVASPIVGRRKEGAEDDAHKKREKDPLGGTDA